MQNISPAPVVRLYLTGRCFAAILAWLTLDQFLNEIKILGIFLILIAVIFSQPMPIYDKKKYGRNYKGFMKHLGGLELNKSMKQNMNLLLK